MKINCYKCRKTYRPNSKYITINGLYVCDYCGYYILLTQKQIDILKGEQ